MTQLRSIPSVLVFMALAGLTGLLFQAIPAIPRLLFNLGIGYFELLTGLSVVYVVAGIYVQQRLYGRVRDWLLDRN